MMGSNKTLIGADKLNPDSALVASLDTSDIFHVNLGSRLFGIGTERWNFLGALALRDNTESKCRDHGFC